MKQGWEVKKLGEVLDILRNGVNCKQDKKGYGDKISRIESISSAKFDIEKVGYAELSKSDKEKYRLNKGDILFSHINSPIHVGKTALFNSDEDIYHGVNLLLMRPKAFLNVNYFEHYLKFLFQKGYWKGLCKQSVNQASVNQQDINKIEISFPKSLPEQQRIVAILDEAFAAIEGAKANVMQNLKNAKELFDSYLQSVFENRGEGWEEKQFSELCDIKHGYAFEGEFFSNAGEFVLLTPGNFYEAGGFRDRGAKQKYYIGQIPVEYVLKKGDLLVAMTEQAAGLLGSPILVPDSDKYLHNQRLGLVKQKSGIPWTNEFFFHVFNTRAVRQAIHNSGSGVKVRHTSPRKIGEVIVSYPTSIKEQMKIVNTLQELSAETKRLEAIYQQKIDNLEELKKSILQKAFNGELG